MNVFLSFESCSAEWGKNAILSFQDNQAIIHCSQNCEKKDRTLVQKAARKLRNQGISNADLSGNNWSLEFCWAFYQGFYSAKQDFSVDFPTLSEFENEELFSRIECIDFVREIINLPSDVLTPEALVNRAAQFIEQQAAAWEEGVVSYNIIKGDELKELGYQGIWTVGRGSVNPPAMLQLDFNPTGDETAPVLACLVGKGITFDTGGYSLKPSNNMDSMKSDMGGAALLTGALGLAIAQGLTLRVKLYLCCAENMISSNAFKLGDIIQYRNDVSVEVMNTDAEGRLVLADGLIEASQQQAQFIIDAATLTGAAKVAVGNDYHSVLSMDNLLVEDLLHSAQQTQEPFWRLPFEELHRGQISSAFADISNTGSVAVSAGASTATAFLSYFVENYQQNWLHIDCSATYRKSASDLWAVGATGIGVQTLADLLLTKGE
ncbi:aminopeptidase PepB [Pasteurellaceae bacterium 22721_9_1]